MKTLFILLLLLASCDSSDSMSRIELKLKKLGESSCRCKGGLQYITEGFGKYYNAKCNNDSTEFSLTYGSIVSEEECE